MWYGFGWESLLLESGFLAVCLGNEHTAPPVLILWLLRWLLFRVEFGAGLIKIREDRCWRDLTCLYYHHETQPMPGPLSWFFHHLRRRCTGRRWRPTIYRFTTPAERRATGAGGIGPCWLTAAGPAGGPRLVTDVTSGRTDAQAAAPFAFGVSAPGGGLRSTA
ncbi:hypothetical protein SANTM175S_00335 [Streptomyces antimycoticus]